MSAQVIGTDDIASERVAAVPLFPLVAPADWLHRRDRVPYLALGVVAIVIVGLAGMLIGSAGISASTILRMVFAHLPFSHVVPDWPASYEAVLWQIRAPRVILAGVVGAALAVSGSTYQGLFRNPLADPYLIGVAPGAALGAVAAIVVPAPAVLYGLGLIQASAFFAGVVTIVLVYGIARVGRVTPVTTLLLAGVALGAFASAITSFLMFAHGDTLHATFSWLLGGLALGSWQGVALTLPGVTVGTVVIWLCARPLNLLQLDEDQAAQLGVDVERMKIVLVGAATLATASAVAVSGLIGFVGLIVPHIIRLIWGPDYRFLVPASAIGGALFLMLADMLARSVLGVGEMPVGVITALCGAPFFLYLLRRKKSMVF